MFDSFENKNFLEENILNNRINRADETVSFKNNIMYKIKLKYNRFCSKTHPIVYSKEKYLQLLWENNYKQRLIYHHYIIKNSCSIVWHLQC